MKELYLALYDVRLDRVDVSDAPAFPDFRQDVVLIVVGRAEHSRSKDCGDVRKSSIGDEFGDRYDEPRIITHYPRNNYLTNRSQALKEMQQQGISRLLSWGIRAAVQVRHKMAD